MHAFAVCMQRQFHHSAYVTSGRTFDTPFDTHGRLTPIVPETGMQLNLSYKKDNPLWDQLYWSLKNICPDFIGTIPIFGILSKQNTWLGRDNTVVPILQNLK